MKIDRIQFNPLGWLLLTLCLLVTVFGCWRLVFGQHTYSQADTPAAPTVRAYYLPVRVADEGKNRRLEVVRIDCSSPDMLVSALSGRCRLQLGFVDASPTAPYTPDLLAQEPSSVSLWARLGLVTASSESAGSGQ